MRIPLPTNLEIKEAKGNKAIAVIEPCYPGYGVTLGNALRRVLLSSIEGAAITAFKVKGASHEFSTLPHVKEDLVEIILNLKRIRLQVFSDEPVKLNLKVKGEKIVTAGDIEKNGQVEIVSADAKILTLTDKNADIEMEITVSKGRGYITVEERAKEKVDLGTIIIDAIYSPMVNVGFEVDSMRVGEKTDFDRLVLKLETDGSISPKDALHQASEILVKHFEFVLNNGKAPKETEKIQEKEVATENAEEKPAKVSARGGSDSVGKKPKTLKRIKEVI